MFAHSSVYFTEIPFWKQPAYILYWDNTVTDVATKATGCPHPTTQDHTSWEQQSQLQIEFVLRGPCSKKVDFLLIRSNPY